MAEQGFEKSEQPTGKRIQEARDKGQVARSQEIPAVAILLTGTLILYLFFPRMYSNFLDLTSEIISKSWSIEITGESIYPLWVYILKRGFFILLPLLSAVFIVSLVSNVLQHGLIFSTRILEFDLSRLNPVSGMQRFISPRSLVELVKGVFKISVVGYAAYLLMKREFSNFPTLIDTDVNYIFSYTGRLVLKLIAWTGPVLVILAVIDFIFQKWQYKKSLMMTKQEVKEEARQMDGDPVIKSRIRSLQREMARKRMMSDVPKADVVITNPVHIAIAVMYKHAEMNAPVVVAKGAGVIAEKIKEIAIQHGIVIVENKPLARTIYRIVEIGEEIPSNLYKAVAEILAYVYKLRKKF